ncbi:hypothetical protein HA466_0190410 [Hirschfeldia incana]|nr:hypothetical protein HA466_0190410 [Hirschfeldia incana]
MTIISDPQLFLTFFSERNREQSLVDLLIPYLGLLISVLQRLQGSKEQYRHQTNEGAPKITSGMSARS